MNPPTLGRLALQQRFVDSRTLDECLRLQRKNYLQGDFRRLGEILVDHGHCSRTGIRALLARQGISIMTCGLCDTRYNVILGGRNDRCLRCGRRLKNTDEHAPLTVEDCLAADSEDAQRMLAEHRQRNPRLGPYEILGEVGRGNMGVIYKAWEERLQRNVALKFLRPDEDVTEEDRERFRREARAVARLKHENIVRVHAIEERGGSLFLAMDFVEGISLEQLAIRGQITPVEAVKSALKIADALHYSHEEGIVHRDVKPQNLLVDRSGKPFLVDFGIAKDRNEQQSLTTEEEVLGSLAYMAPEYVIKGKEALDRRCDVYGLGVVLYEICSGGFLPYGDPGDPGMIKRLFKEEPVPISTVAPDLDPGLARVIMRAIEREVEVRFPTAQELSRELRRTLHKLSSDHLTRSKRPGSSAAAPGPGPGPGPARPRPQPYSRTDETAEDHGQVLRLPEHGPGPGQPSGGQTAQASPLAPSNRSLLLVVLSGLLVVGLAIAGLLAVLVIQNAGQSSQAQSLEAWDDALLRGQALEANGEWAAAETAYTEAAELRPDDARAFLGRARIRDQLGDREGAERDRERARLLGRD